MNFFITAIGLMMVFEGLPLFCSPEQIKEIAQKIQEFENGVLRGFGLFLMILGLIIAYLGRGF
jgi:uncharacterized protein YjeT (DUF2065 family)